MTIINEQAKSFVIEVSQNPFILIFTDGASSGNPGPGGWGAIIAFTDGKIQELGGSEFFTTNNRMELFACIGALESIVLSPSKIQIYTDSTYVIQGITKWIWGWEKRNWITANGLPVANTDLWKVLGKIALTHKIQWNYVPGHAGIPGNERADEIAVAFAQKKKPPLFQGLLLHYPVQIHKLPKKTSLPSQKNRTQSTPKKPYSYLSLVGQHPIRHSSWEECKSRISGQSGARFKKAMSQDEEGQILKSWGFQPEDLERAH